MQKQFVYFPVMLVLFSLMWVPSRALEQDLFLDYTYSVENSEETIIEEEMLRISNALGVAIGVVFYTSGAEYGEWVERNGEDFILLGIDLSSQKAGIYVNGTGHTLLSEEEKQEIFDEVLPILKEKEYAKGVSAFLSLTESVVIGEETKAETQRLQARKLERTAPLILSTLIISFALAYLVTQKKIEEMNNVIKQTHAKLYRGDPYIETDKETRIYSK